MRLYEITKENELWGILSGVDLTFDFDKEYPEVTLLLRVLIRAKNKSVTNRWMYKIDNFENKMNDILYREIPDTNDPDIIKLKNELSIMKLEIDELKAKLL